MRTTLILSIAMITAWGCTSGNKNQAEKPEAKKVVKTAETQTASTKKGAPTTPTPEKAPVAKMGEIAPDFSLKSATGETVTLKQFRGKIVVLEWFNPDCPFVKVAHNEGKLGSQATDHIAKGGMARHQLGAPGMQGHGQARNAEAAKEYGLKHPVLLDEDGAVGARYNALKTPHMYVIDASGKLVYQGALDSTGGQGTPRSTPRICRTPRGGSSRQSTRKGSRPTLGLQRQVRTLITPRLNVC